MTDEIKYPIQVYPDPPTTHAYGSIRGFKIEEFEKACRFAKENSPTVLAVYSPQGGRLTIRSGDIDIEDFND